MVYLFIDDFDIVEGSNDVNTSGKSLIPQELMQ